MSFKQSEEGFLKKNIITIIGDICASKLNYIENAIAQLYLKGCPDIYVLISSPGGNVQDGLIIYDLLSLYPGKKTAIVYDRANSTASVILQACDERFATLHSKVLIHNLRCHIKLDVLRDEKKLKDEIQEAEKLQFRITEIYVKKTKKSVEEVCEQLAKDKRMTVEEAIAFGLLDGIWDKPLPK